MKFTSVALTWLLFATFLTACKKQDAVSHETLYGKWKLIEMYDAYGSGVSAHWNAVPDTSSHYLEFTAGSHYEKTESSGSAFRQCTGNYTFLTGTQIEVNSTCEPTVERMTITELTNEILIIDRLGTEAVIRYKYKADRR